MKLSRERRIYLAILGLGLAGVAADRLWLGSGPAQASASLADQPMASVAVEVAKPSAVVSVARQLENLKSSHAHASTDAFVLPAQWQPQAIVAVDGQAPVTSSPQAAVGAPRVTGLIGRGAAVAAVIDGDPVRLGDVSRSGFRLVSVEHLEVTVERDGRTFVIDLTPKEAAR